MLVLLVGCGAWGRRVADKVERTPGLRLAGIADPLCADVNLRVDSIAGFVGVMNPGMVIVATPPRDHWRVVREIVGAGFRGILRVEKPCGASREDAARIVEACDRPGVRLDAGYTLLDAQWFRQVETWLGERRADVLSVSARRWSRSMPRHDVSARVDMGSHAAAVAVALGAPKMMRLDARFGAWVDERKTWIETSQGGIVVTEVPMGAVIDWPDGVEESIAVDDALAASLQRVAGESRETLAVDPVKVWDMLDTAQLVGGDHAA